MDPVNFKLIVLLFIKRRIKILSKLEEYLYQKKDKECKYNNEKMKNMKKKIFVVFKIDYKNKMVKPFQK